MCCLHNAAAGVPWTAPLLAAAAAAAFLAAAAATAVAAVVDIGVAADDVDA